MAATGSTRMKLLIGAATLFSLGHHLDNLLRGNHVGWPLIPEVPAFTLNPGFYPIIGRLLFLQRRSLGCGVLVDSGRGRARLVGITHLGPWALEPPRDILLAYSSRWAGAVAFAWLIGFLLALLVTAGYGGKQSASSRR